MDKDHLTKEQKTYQEFAQNREPKRKVFRNMLRAFLVGGIICTFGQALQMFFIHNFDFTEKTAGSPATAVLIIITVFLTGFGVYDKMAQWSGAGTVIPITGFANTIASCAIEHKSEGFVLGVGGNMFKLAGSVLAFGTFSAFIVALIKLGVQWIGGM